MKFSEARAVVTGGASGLGNAVARHVVASGGKVAMLDVSQEAGTASANALGANASFFRCDVTSESEVNAAGLGPAPGRLNRQVGWVSTAVGAVTGLVMGLWSFDGPVAVPGFLGEYADTARRLARLGHIAFFGLGILNVLIGWELDRAALSGRAARLASRSMNFGNIGLPLALFAAAAYRPMKYLMPVPAVAVTVALVVVGLTPLTAWAIGTLIDRMAPPVYRCAAVLHTPPTATFSDGHEAGSAIHSDAVLIGASETLAREGLQRSPYRRA